MLVLSRKTGEQITIGDSITITVVEVQGQRIKLGIQAPDSYRILRAELPAEEKPTKRSRPAKKSSVRNRELIDMAAERRRQAPGGSSERLGRVSHKARVHADCAK